MLVLGWGGCVCSWYSILLHVLQDGMTALMWASFGVHTQSVEALLPRGADANIQNDVI